MSDERDWLAEAEHIATGSMLRPELRHLVALYNQNALLVRALAELNRQCAELERERWQQTRRAS
jgi:hypothetical protein